MENIKPGDYMFAVKVKYKDDLAVSGYPFKILEEKLPFFGKAAFLPYQEALKDYSPYWISIIVLIIAILLVRVWQNKKQPPKPHCPKSYPIYCQMIDSAKKHAQKLYSRTINM